MFKFMLATLGAVAEMVRELTVERIREDMAKANIAARKQVPRLADCRSKYRPVLKCIIQRGMTGILQPLILQG